MKMLMTFNHIQAEKSGDLERQTTVEYPMELFIQGVKQMGKNRAIIPFSLKTTTNPQIASFSISGELVIEGNAEYVKDMTATTGNHPPKAWKKVYEDSVDMLTALAKVLEVPFVAPKMQEIRFDN